MSTTYPPDRHLLRDLQLEFEHGEDRTSRAWMPVVPELLAPDGSVRAGALATLVDVVGGGLAAQAAQPDWIATADLTLHLTGAVTVGAVEARARVEHAGRTTVVIEVGLHDGDGREIGLATMSFARLPRRDTNPDVTTTLTAARSTMAVDGSGLQVPLLEQLDVQVVDAAAGVVEAPVDDWSRNSLGSMQGGAVAILVDAATEAAANAARAVPLAVTDLQLTYVALARVGPVRTRVEVLDTRPDVVVARVELIDGGSNDRVTTIGRVVAATSLRAHRGADPQPRTDDHGLHGRERGGGRSRMDI
jgi:uncharacterized protein (TIGR00369 family)